MERSRGAAARKDRACPKRRAEESCLLAGFRESWEEKTDQMFLSVLSRPPSKLETQRFVKHLASDAKATSALVEEAIWVLVSCSEFRFNH